MDEELRKVITEVKETFGIEAGNTAFQTQAAISTLEHIYKVRAQNAQFEQVGGVVGQIIELFTKLKDINNPPPAQATAIPALPPPSPIPPIVPPVTLLEDEKLPDPVPEEKKDP